MLKGRAARSKLDGELGQLTGEVRPQLRGDFAESAAIALPVSRLGSLDVGEPDPDEGIVVTRK